MKLFCNILATIIICTVNKDWEGFNPSPHSFKYFSVPELFSLKGKVISQIKQLAVKFHLIPKTMKGKEKLKRLFFGKLHPLPPEISEEMAPCKEINDVS